MAQKKKFKGKPVKKASSSKQKSSVSPKRKKSSAKNLKIPTGKTSSSIPFKKHKERKIILHTEPKEKIEKAIKIKKSKKQPKSPLVKMPPLPVIEVSHHPKSKVKNILVSQPKPADIEKNPYYELAKKYNLNITFRQFIKIDGLTSQEFRLQRVDILAHGAVILTSKMSVDHYFRMSDAMRITVPETMKYFCINEQTAYYLQKYIQYRKRKIFFGDGTLPDLVELINRNRDDKYLLPASDVQKELIADFLDDIKIKFTKATFYKTLPADLRDIKNLYEFDVLVFFTPVGIKSLKQNFPNFKQGSTRIAAFGHSTAQMAKSLNYRLDIFAPNPKSPSMTSALDTYIKEANKR